MPPKHVRYHGPFHTFLVWLRLGLLKQIEVLRKEVRTYESPVHLDRFLHELRALGEKWSSSPQAAVARKYLRDRWIKSRWDHREQYNAEERHDSLQMKLKFALRDIGFYSTSEMGSNVEEAGFIPSVDKRKMADVRQKVEEVNQQTKENVRVEKFEYVGEGKNLLCAVIMAAKQTYRFAQVIRHDRTDDSQ